MTERLDSERLRGFCDKNCIEDDMLRRNWQNFKLLENANNNNIYWTSMYSSVQIFIILKN